MKKTLFPGLRPGDFVLFRLQSFLQRVAHFNFVLD
jgi:hypothetical protein